MRYFIVFIAICSAGIQADELKAVTYTPKRLIKLIDDSFSEFKPQGTEDQTEREVSNTKKNIEQALSHGTITFSAKLVNITKQDERVLVEISPPVVSRLIPQNFSYQFNTKISLQIPEEELSRFRKGDTVRIKINIAEVNWSYNRYRGTPESAYLVCIPNRPFHEFACHYSQYTVTIRGIEYTQNTEYGKIALELTAKQWFHELETILNQPIKPGTKIQEDVQRSARSIEAEKLLGNVRIAIPVTVQDVSWYNGVTSFKVTIADDPKTLYIELFGSLKFKSDKEFALKYKQGQQLTLIAEPSMRGTVYSTQMSIKNKKRDYRKTININIHDVRPQHPEKPKH